MPRYEPKRNAEPFLQPGGTLKMRRQADGTFKPAVPDAIRVKRIYDDADPGDGYRVLVDHIWPRGISKETAALDEWARELAPSDELRRWFDHVPERFAEFRTRYRAELTASAEQLDALRARARAGTLTLLYAARDQEHNNAVVIAELLRG